MPDSCERVLRELLDSFGHAIAIIEATDPTGTTEVVADGRKLILAVDRTMDNNAEPGVTYGGDGFELKITSGPLLEGWTLLDHHGNVVASAVFPGLSDAP